MGKEKVDNDAELERAKQELIADLKTDKRRKELIKELEKIELQAKKDELLEYIDTKEKEARKLNKIEKDTIADATKQLFGRHYIQLGYDFIERDIDIFYYFANKNKQEFKLPLPKDFDIDYCFNVVQVISYIARLYRYEQRMLSNYIVSTNVELKDIYFKVKNLTKPNKEELENNLLRITALFSDAQIMMQYLIMVFEILEIDKTIYKDVAPNRQLKEEKHKKYITYTLAEYLNDNVFWEDIFDKLEEVKNFLFKDNDKVYSEIKSRLTKSETDTTIATAIQSLKYINKDALQEAFEMQKDIQKHNKYRDVETFKDYLLKRSNNNLLTTSINYLNAISDFYKDQIILKGVMYEKGK